MAAMDSELSILDMESDSDISSASSIPSDFFEEIDDWDVSEGEPGVEATARSFPSDFFDEADMDEGEPGGEEGTGQEAEVEEVEVSLSPALKNLMGEVGLEENKTVTMKHSNKRGLCVVEASCALDRETRETVKLARSSRSEAKEAANRKLVAKLRKRYFPAQSLENSMRPNEEAREGGAQLQKSDMSRSAKLVARALGPDTATRDFGLVREEMVAAQERDPRREECVKFLQSCNFDKLTFAEIEKVTFRTVKERWQQRMKTAMTKEQMDILKPLSIKYLNKLVGGQQVQQRPQQLGQQVIRQVAAPGQPSPGQPGMAGVQRVVINQPGLRPGQPGAQITVPLSTLQALQAGQGIPTGQPGHLLVKTETGQYQILRVGPPGAMGTTQAQLLAVAPASAAASLAYNNSMGQQITPDTAKIKCKNFLATLLRLASDQPESVARNVRALIQGLVDGLVEPELFTTKLQKELNSSPQPCLVPFLKKCLPYLQQSLAQRELTIEGVNPPRADQGELQGSEDIMAELRAVVNRTPRTLLASLPSGLTVTHVRTIEQEEDVRIVKEVSSPMASQGTGEAKTELLCPICSGTFLDLITLETHAADCDGTQEESAYMGDDPDLEAIGEKRERLRQLQNKVDEVKTFAERIVESKAPQLSRLMKGSEQAKVRMLKKQKAIADLDDVKAELDARQVEVEAKKVKLVQECEQESKFLEELEKEKRWVDNWISVKTEEARKDTEKLEEEIKSLKAAEIVKKKAVEDRAPASSLPDSWKLDYITKKIEAKEKDLECPVCFEVANTPIFKCLEDHLICSVCRPKVLECPECRVRYTGEPRRHRYAEKAAAELEELWRERAEVLGD